MFKTKIRYFLSFRRVIAASALGLLVLLGATHALTAQPVSQGYDADSQLQRGMIVMLKKDDSNKVEPLTQDKINLMHGVIVDANDAPVTLSLESHKVFVATSGHFDVLVTNQNGAINTGDYISISALAGVGMKANTVQPVVIGKALKGFSDDQDTLGRVSVKDVGGNSRTINLGRIPVDVMVTRNPWQKPIDENLPGFLKKATEAIADKPVPPVRIYMSLALLLGSFLVAGSMLYGGVRSSIVSVGRNPLSKRSIIKSLLQVTLTGLIIFIMGTFGVYLLLKL